MTRLTTPTTIACLVLGLAGCGLDTPSLDSVGQAIEATKLIELDLGRETNISYGFVDPPEPDRAATLELLFAPVKELRRSSTYVGLAGERSVVVTADPPGELVTGDPPGGVVTADPPGSVDPPNPDLEMAIYNREGTLVSRVFADPPGSADPPGGVDPPEPDHVTISVHLEKDATINVFDADGKLISSTTAR